MLLLARSLGCCQDGRIDDKWNSGAFATEGYYSASKLTGNSLQVLEKILDISFGITDKYVKIVVVETSFSDNSLVVYKKFCGSYKNVCFVFGKQ